MTAFSAPGGLARASRSPFPALPALPALLLSLSALLSACGGGDGAVASSSGSDSASSALSTVSGTVTGFGSVVVDGTEIEDATARIARVNPDGSLSNDVLQLGQRVRLSRDGDGKASQVLIDAAVIGQVAAAPDTSARTLTVAGQAVSYNEDSAAAVPLTVFGGGYTSTASVAAGDTVEIHGSPFFDSASQRYVVQATRIQKLSGVTRVQVRGAISGYSATATGARFTLNGLNVLTTASTALHPSGSVLADGSAVTVYGSALSGNTLTASHVRLDRSTGSASTAAAAAQLSGLVSGASATGFTVQGTPVVVSASTVFSPAGTAAASLADGAWVVVRGTLSADGQLAASRVDVRSANGATALARVLLVGPISDFVDASQFVVRGVPVDASGIDFASACPGVTPANELSVRVLAQQQVGTAVVRATQIQCRPASTMVPIRHLDGSVTAVDATAGTFTLTPASTSSATAATAQTVQWTASTTFLDGLSAASLTGQTVRVEGYLSGTVLVARVLRLGGSAGSAALDDHDFRGGAQARGWGQYRQRHR